MFVPNLPIQSRAGIVEIKEHDATAWQWQNGREG